MDYYPYIVLAHHILCTILAIFALKFTISVVFYQKITKSTASFSPILYFYFIFIIIWGISSLINRCYLIIFWRPTGNSYDGRILYWLGFIIFLLGHIGTGLEICMCIDRCATILYPMQYTTKLHIYYSYGTIVALCIYVFAILQLNQILAVIPNTATTKCVIFSCLLTNAPTQNLLPTKMVIMGINSSGGIILFILLKTKLNSNNDKNKQIIKKIVKIIASSTIFEMIPIGLTYFFSFILNIYLNTVIGPFDPTSVSINITICAYLYSRAFTKAFQISNYDGHQRTNNIHMSGVLIRNM